MLCGIGPTAANKKDGGRHQAHDQPRRSVIIYHLYHIASFLNCFKKPKHIYRQFVSLPLPGWRHRTRTAAARSRSAGLASLNYDGKLATIRCSPHQQARCVSYVSIIIVIISVARRDSRESLAIPRSMCACSTRYDEQWCRRPMRRSCPPTRSSPSGSPHPRLSLAFSDLALRATQPHKRPPPLAARKADRAGSGSRTLRQ